MLADLCSHQGCLKLSQREAGMAPSQLYDKVLQVALIWLNPGEI